MSTARAVPVTRDEELEGEEALKTLRACGSRRLLVGSVVRFRAADGFSHSRALGFQIVLTLLPALIAVVGLAEAFEQATFRRAVQDVLNALAPGSAGDLLTDALRQGSSAARREAGEWAIAGGLLAALISGTTAMAQIERGANRIYGTERDRPFLRKCASPAGPSAWRSSSRPWRFCCPVPRGAVSPSRRGWRSGPRCRACCGWRSWVSWRCTST